MILAWAATLNNKFLLRSFNNHYFYKGTCDAWVFEVFSIY